MAKKWRDDLSVGGRAIIPKKYVQFLLAYENHMSEGAPQRELVRAPMRAPKAAQPPSTKVSAPHSLPHGGVLSLYQGRKCMLRSRLSGMLGLPCPGWGVPCNKQVSGCVTAAKRESRLGEGIDHRPPVCFPGKRRQRQGKQEAGGLPRFGSQGCVHGSGSQRRSSPRLLRSVGRGS